MPYEVCENVSKEALYSLWLRIFLFKTEIEKMNRSEAKKDSIGGEIEIDI